MEIDIQEIGLAPGYRVVKYPFVREQVELICNDGPYEVASWRPGIRWEDFGPEDIWAMADGEGYMMLTVVGAYKPDRFPTRIFYTRQFSDPDGHVFGKTKLQICTLEKFRRISSAYHYYYTLT